jgi:circadian clock protein KaiC
MKTIGVDLEPLVKSGSLNFYYSRPTLQTLELHLISIKIIIKKINAKVIILDPITIIMIEELNSDMRSMLTRFIDYLKMEQITVMLCATVTTSSLELIQSNEGISSMVDTCIMLEVKKINQLHKKYIYIMKSRGINNSKEEYEFIISNEGIIIDSKKQSH